MGSIKIENRKARHDYEIIEKTEAGIVRGQILKTVMRK